MNKRLKRYLYIFFIVIIITTLVIILPFVILGTSVPKDREPSIIGVDGDVHAVFTWVDSGDEAWCDIKSKYDSSSRSKCFDSRRFGDGKVTNIEIETAVISVLKYAPWVDKIWIATANQIPTFMARLDCKYKNKVRVIFHKDFFVNSDDLPTFNSHSIEANLHNIPGLSERFIYLNDDMMFTSLVTKNHFFKHGLPCYRPIKVFNVKRKFMEKFMKKINPSSDTFLACTSQLANYCNYLWIWRQSHHATPLLKSYFSNNISYTNIDISGRSPSVLCRTKFRCKEDIPPIHAAFLQAYADRRCRIYEGKYSVKYFESFAPVNLRCYHEICVNNVVSEKEALTMKKCVLQV